MDLIFELLQQADINKLRGEIERLRHQSIGIEWDGRRVKELMEENLGLKLRLGLLVRLLIAKGAFTAEEYAGLVAAAQRDLKEPGAKTK